MKSLLLTSTILLTACLLTTSACNNGTNNSAQNTADSAMAKVDTAVNNVKQGAENAAAAVQNAATSNPDSDFVVKAATVNAAELKILQAGIDNGTSKDLKAHARMMMADHKKLGEKVKAFAQQKGYILPDGDNGKADDELSKLGQITKGPDWDKEWVTHMVNAHQDAISMFENAQTSVKSDDLKQIISGALPTLHSHLDMMKALQDKLGK